MYIVEPIDTCELFQVILLYTIPYIFFRANSKAEGGEKERNFLNEQVSLIETVGTGKTKFLFTKTELRVRKKRERIIVWGKVKLNQCPE